MKLVDICMDGNEHGKLAEDTIYAQLVEDDGSIVTSATLDYILAAIRDSNYEVDGVTVERGQQRGVECSHVRLTRYDSESI